MKEISIHEIEGYQIGNAQNVEAGTGCTMIMCKEGAAAGLDVRGGGPASRETELLKSVANAQMIHGVLLSGGSAFGLDAAGGAMKYLEERGIGFDVGITKVPLICQSCIFDLRVGDPFIRPDQRMAYEACENAEKKNYKDGNYGAGCGATIGKLHGIDGCMKSGVGSYAVQIGELKVGAIVVVNALGDVYDYKTGKKVAGLLNNEHTAYLDSEEEMFQSYEVKANKFVDNTTIGAVLTNARFQKTQLNKIAAMTHNGYARTIRPVHTSADGDSIYALATGVVEADQDMVASLAAHVMSEAIVRGVKAAESAYGLLAWKECEKLFH